jgi:ABC-type nitrate/sulfonate/bicarbonate transport system substrate-binding protein
MMTVAIRLLASVSGLFIGNVLLFANLHAATGEKVNASYGAISGSMLPIWVAREARLFDKHGLDLNLVYISGGPRSIMSLIGGSVQFVNHSGMPALEAHQRGADTAMIASPMNQLEHSLVVQKNITGAEQLRGKVMGISTLGSLTDVILREGLRLNHLSEKDVTILAVGDLGARLSGFRPAGFTAPSSQVCKPLPLPRWVLDNSSTFRNCPSRFPDPVSLSGGRMSARIPKPPSSFLEVGSKEFIY